MKLTQVDVNSATWAKLSAHLNERIEIFRKRNDGDLNEKDTARLRARIKELEYILSLATPKEYIEQ